VTSLNADISSAEVPPGAVRLWWLGQAGFAFKAHNGLVALVDPYLSDAVERLHGFKRLSVAPIAAEQVRARLVCLTHEHADHLDPDALPVIARNNPDCTFAAPEGCWEGLDRAGVAAARRIVLRPGEACELHGVTIYPARADHGDYAPTAVSFVLDFDGVRVLYTGDTALRPEMFRPLYDLHPDVLIPCINGGFGNMTHIDAAMMAQQAHPRFAIPCHFWTFAEQGAADPAGFLHACAHFCPDVQAMLLRPGEGFTCARTDRTTQAHARCHPT